MQLASQTSRLDEFAAQYIRDIWHHCQVEEGDLAEAVRRRFFVPPFPTRHNLLELCLRMGIVQDTFPSNGADLKGVNIALPQKKAYPRGCRCLITDLTFGGGPMRVRQTSKHEVVTAMRDRYWAAR